MAYNLENYEPSAQYQTTITTGKNLSVGGTLSVTGTVTASGGIAGATPVAIDTVPIGSVAYASFGNDTTMVAGTVYFIGIVIPRNFTVTNINVLQGTIAGTDKLIGALYNSAGTLVANSALAGVTVTTSNTFLTLPLTSTYSAIGPGQYYLSISSNGTTDKIRTVAANTFVTANTNSATGTFGTLAAITPPTSFSANKGPIAYIN
jgi:hypothetical protein